MFICCYYIRRVYTTHHHPPPHTTTHHHTHLHLHHKLQTFQHFNIAWYLGSMGSMGSWVAAWPDLSIFHKFWLGLPHNKLPHTCRRWARLQTYPHPHPPGTNKFWYQPEPQSTQLDAPRPRVAFSGVSWSTSVQFKISTPSSASAEDNFWSA